MFRFDHGEPVGHEILGLMEEAEYRVSVEMADGSRLVRVRGDFGRRPAHVNPPPELRVRPSEIGDSVILVDDDEVVEAFARGTWSRVVREVASRQHSSLISGLGALYGVTCRPDRPRNRL